MPGRAGRGEGREWGVKREGTEVPAGTRSWRRHHPSCPTLSSPGRSPQACGAGNKQRFVAQRLSPGPPSARQPGFIG